MANPKPEQADNGRIRVGQDLIDQLAALFPGVSHRAAISELVKNRQAAVGDPIFASETELWLKLARLDETLGLLALTNMDLADCYRRELCQEAAKIQTVAVKLAELVANSGRRA